jgi:hypothetical protein
MSGIFQVTCEGAYTVCINHVNHPPSDVFITTYELYGLPPQGIPEGFENRYQILKI